MTSYIDSSALLKRYLQEPDSEYATSLIDADDVLVTSWLTVVEVHRSLTMLLKTPDLGKAKLVVTEDFDKMALVLPDVATWLAAAEIGVALKVRSLDAVHLACAQRLRIPGIRFVTFDIRQAIAARSLGFSVVGS